MEGPDKDDELNIDRPPRDMSVVEFESTETPDEREKRILKAQTDIEVMMATAARFVSDHQRLEHLSRAAAANVVASAKPSGRWQTVHAV